MAVLGNSWVKKFLELGSKIYTEAQKKCDSRSWPMLPVRVCSTFVLNFGNSWRHHVQWIFELEIGSVDSSTSVRQHNMIIALGAARIRIRFFNRVRSYTPSTVATGVQNKLQDKWLSICRFLFTFYLNPSSATSNENILMVFIPEQGQHQELDLLTRFIFPGNSSNYEHVIPHLNSLRYYIMKLRICKKIYLDLVFCGIGCPKKTAKDQLVNRNEHDMRMSLCLYRVAPSDKPPIKMFPSTFRPHPGFYVFIVYMLQETARLSVCACQVQSSILPNFWRLVAYLCRVVSLRQ